MNLLRQNILPLVLILGFLLQYQFSGLFYDIPEIISDTWIEEYQNVAPDLQTLFYIVFNYSPAFAATAVLLMMTNRPKADYLLVIALILPLLVSFAVGWSYVTAFAKAWYAILLFLSGVYLGVRR